MLNVNLALLNGLQENVKYREMQTVTINSVRYTNEVKSSELNLEGRLNATNIRQLKLTLHGKHAIQGQYIAFERSFTTLDRTTYTIPYGAYRALEVEYNDDTKTTDIVAYDDMLKTHREYKQEDMNLMFPTSLVSLFRKVAQVVGLECDVTSFANSTEIVTEDKYAGLEYTYRDVLDHIAEVAGMTVGIKNGKLDIWGLNSTGLVIDYKRSRKLKIGEEVGAFNILNLTREPQHDNYAYPETWSNIPLDDRVEYVIENNQIADKDREHFAPLIFNQISALNYHTFTADTFGWGVFDVGDIVTVRDLDGTEYQSIITSELNKSTGMWQTELKSEKIHHAKEEYALVTDVRREFRSTYLLVDQQNGKIQALTQEVSASADKISGLQIDLDSVKTSVEDFNVQDNLIPNLSGEYEDYQYWQWVDTEPVKYFNTLMYRDGMRYSTNFEINYYEYSLSKWGLSFYGNGMAISAPTTVKAGREYSFRTRRMSDNLLPFTVIVRENYITPITKEMEHIKDTPFILEGNVYEELSIEPQAKTNSMQLIIVMTNASYANRIVLSENMFNRGQPKEWKESPVNIKFWTRSALDVMSDSIYHVVEDAEYDIAEIYHTKKQINQTIRNDFGSISTNNQTVSEIEFKVEDEDSVEGIRITDTNTQVLSKDLTFNDATGDNLHLNNNFSASSVISDQLILQGYQGSYELFLSQPDSGGNCMVIARKVEVE